jgi:hypothetical protein
MNVLMTAIPDPDLGIILKGRVSGIRFWEYGVGTWDSPGTNTLLHHRGGTTEKAILSMGMCPQPVCTGCPSGQKHSQALKITPIRFNDLPLYILNITTEFEKYLYNGYGGPTLSNS